MSVAFLFSGQGSQAVGTGADLLGACEECRSIFQVADQSLDFPLSRVVFEGTDEEFRSTAIAQPALLTLAVAHAAYLRKLGVVPDILCGHSLGQYAALVVAGSVDFASAVRLVAARGRLMQQTVPDGAGAMLAILGLDRERIYAACAASRAIGVVNVACHNAPGQSVISGTCDAVDAAGELCESLGGTIVPLSVSVPFHSDLLLPMIPAFTQLLQTIPMVAPSLSVIDNVTARPLLDATAVRQSLITHVTAPVLFEESVRCMVSLGTTRFVQCGPGETLLKFARQVTPTAELTSFAAAALGGKEQTPALSRDRSGQI